MKNNLFLLLILCVGLSAYGKKADYEKLFGQWKGVKMFQDENSYDGRTFFLPNEGEMILNENTVNIYYYPYFKSAQFDVTYTDESIFYKINEKEIRCDYHFKADTLVFKMQYINKVFVKLFTRTTLNEYIIADLDKHGFRTTKLAHEFELDTLHPEQKKGFSSYDSLGFVPYKYLKFKGENTLILDRKHTVTYTRGFNEIRFSYNGVMNTLKVAHLGGTQDIFLKPATLCQCDSLIIPYMAVPWADRIRQAIIDEENF